MDSRLQQNRRGFIGLAASGAAGLIGGGWSSVATALTGADADLIVRNAKVYTVDDSHPTAQAFAVRNGRFIAIGSSEEIAGLAGRRTTVIDAKGMTVTPGFIDCHNHASGNSLLYDVLVGNPFEVEFVTIDSIIQKLRARAAETPGDSWIRGEFYDDTKIKDKRPLDIRDLDKVSTTRPVSVRHRGGHTMVYNSKAFELAGVTKDTPDMPSGTYDKFPDGTLNGRVTDRANAVFEKAGRTIDYSPDERDRRDREGAAHISQMFARYGLTGVCHQGGNLRAIQQIRAQDRLLHRVSYEPAADVVETMIAAGQMTGFGDEWIRLGATIEHTADGSFSERTMALSAPYPGSTTGYRGNVTETQDDLNAWCKRMHRAGIQVNCHANGDVAIDHVLTAYERAQRLLPNRDTRWKITHCSLVNDDLLRRMKALGVSPALFNTYAYYNADKFHFYGKELMSHMMPYRSMLDMGIPACIGSDFPPGPFSPLMGIQGMVTRTGWNGETWGANQRINVAEAIRVSSLNGAYDTHEEHIKGSITPGKLADFVMLADDPHTIDPSRIKDIQIVRTVVGGRTVYQA